jgi:hypothetical protein
MTPKKKLAVCGCSFQAPSHQFVNVNDASCGTYAGTHWSELSSQRMGYELVNLAVPGASTAVVILQIFEAIKQNVDFIVIANSASSNRLEFYNRNETSYPPELRNFYYATSRSNPFVEAGETPNDYLTSMGIQSVEPEAFRDYLAMNVAVEMMDIKDNWMFLYAISKVVKSKIPFLVFEGRVSMPAALSINDDLLEICVADNIVFRKDFDPFKIYLSAFEAPSYHTHPDQQKPIADYIETRIRKLLCL